MLGKRAPGAKRPAKAPKILRVTASMASGNPYKADKGLNVGDPQRYLSTPSRMQVCIPWQADTRYVFASGPVTPGFGYIRTPYLFLDPLDIDSYVNNDPDISQAFRFFYSSDLWGLASLYQNMTFRTHILNYTFTFDYTKANLTDPLQPLPVSSNNYILPAIDIAVGVLPITFLKDETGVFHTAAQAGTIFQGVDYYSALTKQRGTKTYSLSQGSVHSVSGSLLIDAYDHNGEPQTLSSFSNWRTPFPIQPTVQFVFPDPPFRKVFLIAMRIPEAPIDGVLQVYDLRAAFRLDQHLTCFNQVPSFPYVVGDPAT